MPTLSGQTIQSTYQGLLKLANSTTGITNSFQAIEDGLGNNTGMRIKNNFLTQDNQLSIGKVKNNYFGNGISSGTGNANISNHNTINTVAFWDAGIYSYSAISFTIQSASTTSDVFEAAFYTSEIGSNGLYPKNVIISGITASTTGTLNTLRTYVFPNNISFSGSPGMNFILMKTSSVSSLRTFNYYNNFIVPSSSHFATAYGYAISPAGNTTTVGYSYSNSGGIYTGLTFNTSYVESDFSNPVNANGLSFGFIIHTVK